MSNEATPKAAEAKAAKPQKSRTLWSDAWKRLKRNKLAMLGAIWIIFMVIVAVSAPLWAPSVLGDPTARPTWPPSPGSCSCPVWPSSRRSSPSRFWATACAMPSTSR